MREGFRGRHIWLGREVAVKVLPLAECADDEFRARFEREARIVAGLRHPNIVQVYDFGEAQGMYFMAMEFIDGVDQMGFLKRHGPLQLRQALPLLHEVAGALDHAHTQGIVHRDVKPSNVLLELDPATRSPRRAVLSDFGISKMLSQGINLTLLSGSPVGTPAYMAPEQIRGDALVDARADIYSLGIMTYELLTGALPFDGERIAVLMAHLTNRCPDPRETGGRQPAGRVQGLADLPTRG